MAVSLTRAGGATLLLALLSVASAAPGSAQEAARTADRPQMVLHILDYVAADYPEAVRDGHALDPGEYQEQLEFVAQARALVGELPSRPEQAAMIADADRLLGLVRDKRAAAEVSDAAARLRSSIVNAYQVQVAPRRAPDLQRAASLYTSHCASCHGPEGRGDGPAGRSLDPRPRNFHDTGRMELRSAYSLYSTITLGVAGTGMASFHALPEDERWGLAFYVASLGGPEPLARRGAELWRAGRGRQVFPDLASVATATAQQVAARDGADGVALLTYLQAHPEVYATPAVTALATSVSKLRESVDAFRQGRAADARALAAESYLDGFELAEPALDAVDAPLRVAVEAEMTRYRSVLRDDTPLAEVEAQAAAVEARLAQARARLDAGGVGPSTAFASALLILLREGLEAILILAAIYALLVRAERRDALRYVHAGWIAALVLGGLTWAAASYVISISGATREVTEGVTGLLAAAVLLYVGFWMHGKSYTQQWQDYLVRRLRGALGRRTLATLAFVSFLAVYREAFETVLFGEVLAVQAGPAGRTALLAGFACAAVLLLVLGWLIVQGSVRLPLGAFFGGSSILIALLAVVFAGKGIAALQESGWLPVHPVSFPSLPVLGIYPNLHGLLLQAALVIVIAAGFAQARRAAARST